MPASSNTNAIQFLSKSTGNPMFPITKMGNVTDDRGSESLSKYFTEYNVITHYSGTFTLEQAIAKVPSELRIPGLKLIFTQTDGTIGYYMLNKSTWSTSISDWTILNVDDEEYEFVGIADTSTVYSSETGKRFYIAPPATYKNFKSLSFTVNKGQIGIVKYNTSYSVEIITVVDIVNDLTSGGTASALSAEQGKVLNDKVNSLNSTLTEKETAINSEISKLRTAINDQNATLNSKIDVVKTDISDLGDKIDDIDSSIGDLKTQMSNLDASTNTKLTNMTNTLGKFTTSTNTKLNDIKKEVDDFKGSIVVLSLEEYNALKIKDASVFYYVYEEE